MSYFGRAEKIVQNYFEIGQTVKFNHDTWEVLDVGKPTCGKGEPKTDIYLLLARNGIQKEIKISYKKDNADFLENKINAERAEQILGSDWQSIIWQSTQSIRQSFLAKPLIYKNGLKKTEQGAITLGWKFELMNKPSGELSGKILLSKEQVIDVYCGNNLSEEKKNAFVNRRQIPNSGVANYILVGQDFSCAEDVLNQITPIEQYATRFPDIYFACKALNYRTFKDKFDGNRPLCVQVDWSVVGSKLTPNLVFDRPLSWNGNDVAGKLKDCLLKLNIKTTNDINEFNADKDDVYE